MPKVSVIISAYNHEKYVAETVGSVLDQGFSDLELLIVDDASTDGTAKVISRFNDPRIKAVYSKINLDETMAVRTHLLDKIGGQYVAYLCSDDAFEKNKLEKQVEFLDSHPDVAAVFSRAKLVGENGEDFRDRKHSLWSVFDQDNRSRFQWLNHFFYRGNCLCNPSAMIRTQHYKDLRAGDARFHQLGDFDLWIKICMKSEIYVLPEKLVRYRIRAHNANMSAPTPEVKRRNILEEIQILKGYLAIKNPDDFIRIFPEMSKHRDKIDEDTIPYLLAKLALGTSTPSRLYFGIDTLFESLADDRIAAKLKERFGFTHKDLIKITGSHDLFHAGQEKEKGAR